jgi:A/G-specific adenine glycosylase
MRQMPWRADAASTPDPYHVMVSEFMLQQTVVKTVIPYFERFILKFPDLGSLASADLDDVYKLWQGLGYYSRAKNLQKAAQQVVQMECFPSDTAILKTLAGVGDYTSAAIAAIAFDKPVLPIDGNVMRVMSRFFMLSAPKGKELYKETEKVISIFSSDSGNRHTAQALMELGALICRPKNPFCNLCPIQLGCESKRKGEQDLYPKLLVKFPKPKRIATCFMIQNSKGEFMLVKRPNKGLFSNMFVFPTTLFDFDPYFLTKLNHLEKHNKRIKHVFTHFELTLTIVTAKISSQKNDFKNVFWVSKNNLKDFAIPTLMRKVINIYI